MGNKQCFPVLKSNAFFKPFHPSWPTPSVDFFALTSSFAPIISRGVSGLCQMNANTRCDVLGNVLKKLMLSFFLGGQCHYSGRLITMVLEWDVHLSDMARMFQSPHTLANVNDSQTVHVSPSGQTFLLATTLAQKLLVRIALNLMDVLDIHGVQRMNPKALSL